MKTVRSMRSLALALVGAALVVAALVVLPLPAAAGLFTGGSAAFAVAMLRAGARDEAAGPRLRALVLGAGTLLTALAGLAAGAAVVFAPEVKVDGVPLPSEIALVCVFLAAICFLPGLLRPHQRRDPLARLRVGLDTVGVAACVMFSPWLVLFGAGEQRGASVTAIMAGGTATAIAAVSGVHAVRHRAALMWCGSGASLSLLGLTALAIALDYPEQVNASIASVAAAGAINVAAGLLWYGSVRVRPDGGPLPPVGGEPAAGFPLFALPVLAAGLVIAWHLVHGGDWDPVAVGLAVTALLAVAAREYLASVVLRRQASHLTDQGNRLRSLMFGSSDVAMVLDADLAVRWQSPAAARQFALSDQDVLGRPVSALVHPDSADAVHAYLGGGKADRSLTVRLRDGFGRWRDTEWTAGGEDPADPGRSVVVHVRDISDERDLEHALRQTAYADPQTGLANRKGLRRAADPPAAGALIVLELGGLTAISDVRGPALAEMVIVEAARRLRIRVETTDVPARIGDTRFAVLTRGGAVRAHVLASQLVNVLTAPYAITGDDSIGDSAGAHVSVWAGMADLAEDSDVDEVIRRAGLAVRAIRSGPPGTVEWYDEEMEARLKRRSTLEQDLPGAIDRDQLNLSFRPVVELPGRRPVGVEVVIDWRHPALGVVPAAEMLPLAEELGLSGDLSHWALHRACRQLAGWRREHPDLWLSINVRPRELLEPAFATSLDAALASYDVAESALVVEIAEHELLHGPEAQQPAYEDVAVELGRLRARGIRTSVGNFGTGPTSLSRLRVLPADLLKIDREVFGQPVGATGKLGAIMDVTVTLGRRLGMEVVAQGVRSEDDLETVLAAGCRLGQGDLLGRPQPAERFEALLEQHRDRSQHG